MIKLADALHDIIASHPFFEMGLHRGLFNLTQLARYLRPHVCARAKKDVQETAILMALSRMQREFREKQPIDPERFVIDKLSVQAGLTIATFPKSLSIQRSLASLFERTEKREGFITVSQGTSQITLIFEDSDRETVLKRITVAPERIIAGVSSIGLRFSEKYLDTPGLLYFILQQLYVERVNILELTSTATELVVYLKDRDVRNAFDALHYRFQRTTAPRAGRRA
jgi:aspartokinase